MIDLFSQDFQSVTSAVVIPEEPEEEKQPISNIYEFSVSELVSSIKRTLEGNFEFVKVRGEISELKKYPNAYYFNLKEDKDSFIKATCFKNVFSKVDFNIEDGIEVVISGKVTCYRSDVRITVTDISVQGQGALMLLLEKLKQKLALEGLFDSDRKKPIPQFPKIIGLITSSEGAVIHDMQTRLEQRFFEQAVLYPVRVQGDSAPPQIIEAIRFFNSLPINHKDRPDVIIIARGGGSFEDLFAFNNEDLVRAVAASIIPIISAIGHEPDYTLIDYAADLRAPTPTAAAEIVAPLKRGLIDIISERSSKICNFLNNKLSHDKLKLENVTKAIQFSSSKKVPIYQKQLDNFTLRSDAILKSLILKKSEDLHTKAAKLLHPNQLYDKKLSALEKISIRLSHAWEKTTEQYNTEVKQLEHLLSNLGYVNTVQRGYAVVTDIEGKVLSSISTVSADQTLKIRMKDGELEVLVKKLTSATLDNKDASK